MELSNVLTKQQLREFIKEQDFHSIEQIQQVMKNLIKEILEEAFTLK